jgi:prepilin-type N-terminal cleavage/methylation domain-containing protein
VKIRANGGFSLIEMMIVCALLGFIATVATPSFMTYRQNSNLREAAGDLSSDIALYRQRAVAENRGYQITFNQAANNYTVNIETPPGTGTYTALNPAVTKSPGAISSPVIISGITFIGTPPQIIIQPRGIISNLPPSGLGTVTLQHTTSSKTAVITTNLMGRINVQYP